MHWRRAFPLLPRFSGAEDGFRKAAFRLEAHGVNHRVDAAMSRRVIDNPLRRVVMVSKFIGIAP
jgi:hypothetical protein